MEKNERENTTRRGRKFPLTNSIRDILDELKALQDDRGIVSDYILCHEDGDWIKTDAYKTCLRRVCRNLGFTVTNNHALHMGLNSNVFIPLNIPVTKRAELLGHSVETNLKYYSYALNNYAANVPILQFKAAKMPCFFKVLWFFWLRDNRLRDKYPGS